MTDEIDLPQAWMDAGPPFDFALSIEGCLLLTFRLSGHPMGLKVPAAELKRIQRMLESTGTMRDMLAVKPPEKGGH